jgi:hypothetical protein
MNFSLTLLIALYMLLPGAAFVFGFTRLHNPNRAPTPLDQHLPIGLAVMLLAAIFLNALWFAIWKFLLTHCYPNQPLPDAGQLVALLGSKQGDAFASRALQSVDNYPLRIAAYFSGLPVAAWVMGRIINSVWNWIYPNDSHASWYDLLKPNEPDFVWLTTDVHLDGRCFLFAGLVSEFSVSRNGNLERVVLELAVRKPLDKAGVLEQTDTPSESDLPDNTTADISGANTQLNNDQPAEKDGGQDFDNHPLKAGRGWTVIPGEFVVLKMAHCDTVNLDYFYMDLNDSEGTECAA